MTEDSTEPTTDGGYVTVEYSREEKQELYGPGPGREDRRVGHRRVIYGNPVSWVIRYFSICLDKLRE